MSYSLTQDPLPKSRTGTSPLHPVEPAPKEGFAQENPLRAPGKPSFPQQIGDIKTGTNQGKKNQGVDHEFVAALLNLQNPLNAEAQNHGSDWPIEPEKQNSLTIKNAQVEMTDTPLRLTNSTKPDTQINTPEIVEPEIIEIGMLEATQFLNTPVIPSGNTTDNKIVVPTPGQNSEHLQTNSNQKAGLARIASAEIMSAQSNQNMIWQAPPQETQPATPHPASQPTPQLTANDTKMSAPILMPQIPDASKMSAPTQTPNINPNPTATPTPMDAFFEGNQAARHVPKSEILKAAEYPGREFTLPDPRILKTSGAIELTSMQTAPLAPAQNFSGGQMNTVLTSPQNQSMPILTQIGQALGAQVMQQIPAATDKPGSVLNPVLVQLSPAELGRVQIQFRFDSNERITANIIAESAETGVLLKQKSDMLFSLLKQSGFNNIDLSLEAKNESNFSNFGSNGAKNQNAQSQHVKLDNSAEHQAHKEPQETPQNPHPTSTKPSLTNGQIDISL